ncbi:heme peroxidase [Lentinus tigrinus ALCF2SS1-6]|uniref:Heme peroxidase n=2 Tax=Lentinus tigrinus TaxID=5365 RepID=A0A5C2SLH3_9APHY|nr:heme peroxidase [Lentinus tigrinus ALCF2SS1-6]
MPHVLGPPSRIMSAISSRLSRTFSYNSQSAGEDVASSTGAHLPHGLQEFRDKVKKHLPMVADLSTMESIVDAVMHLNNLDDRKMMLEHVLVLLSNNAEHPLAQKIETLVIKALYEDLPHPPATIVGPNYAFRTVDGSGNNPCMPDLGKAGTSYSRSVQQIHPLPADELPDAGLLFDTLLRRDKFVPHPAGLSSLMFSFAALVIHTVFRTSHKETEVHINDTSSYIDLAPLYGSTEEALNKIRVRDGRGLLLPDTFAEDRLLLLPPAVCVLLVLFSRNHNYIAKKLFELNERGTYQDPVSLDDKSRVEQEENIFQTARLINCAWFGSAVFADYVAAILGLVRQGSSWSLNPFEEVRNMDHSLFERGKGNQCSVEFNCLYRWHATTSQADEKWVEQLSDKLFHGKAVESLTIQDFKQMAADMKNLEPDASHWTFGNLQRDEKTNKFDDAKLAGVLKDATEHPAGAFKARGTPHVMRLHEIMGIEQSRRWGVCSLNDFRKFLGLKTYSSFLEWNPDPEIANAAEKLYGHIDRLELYVGLQAEEAKPVIPGAGLCPSYTISRAILSDAIALTRGDRFFTADYTPFNMTAWGFADCQRDPNGPGNGSMLGRLLMRTLPEQYPSDSTYAWFPLMTPAAMQKILGNLGWTNTYDLKRPTGVPQVQELVGYADVQAVLKDEVNFGTGFAERLKGIVNGPGFFIASNDPAKASREQRDLLKALLGAQGAQDNIKQFFYEKTRELMQRESCQSVGTSVHTVDIVRDVLRVVPIYWACDLAGIRLKAKADDDGDYTAKELFAILADIYAYLFLDVEPSHLHKLRRTVTVEIEKLSGLIRRQFGGSRFFVSGLLETVSHFFSKTENNGKTEFAARLHELGVDTDTQCNMILAFLVGSTVELSQAMVNVIDFYLDPAKPVDVQTLANKPSTLAGKDEATMQGFVAEALRLCPTFRGAYRQTLRSIKLSQGTLPAGQRVFIDVAKANVSRQALADPQEINPARGLDKYLMTDGAGRVLGVDLCSKIIAHTVRAVYSFKGITRAPGQSGKLKRHKDESSRTSNWVYLAGDQYLCPWANSMFVQFS